MSIYKEFRREPSMPHQCMHHSDKDGKRCRGRAMHNEIMCFHHRDEDIPTVIQNDPYELTSLYDRASIQHALTEIAARLAANHMDLKRAALLLQSCKIAKSNLDSADRTAAAKTTVPSLTPPPVELDPNPDPEALIRYQAYRAELGLDDDEPPAPPPTPPTAISQQLSADLQNPPAPNPPTEIPEPLAISQQPSADLQKPAAILPTLNAVATEPATSYKQQLYPRTEMPENVITTRPRMGTPNALAGWNTHPSNWFATWVLTPASSGPPTTVKSYTRPAVSTEASTTIEASCSVTMFPGDTIEYR
jgi:hypothetical protein